MSTTVVAPPRKPFTWSYSAVKAYENCPKRHWHLAVAKDYVEPPSPALEEGNALHQAFDQRIRKGKALPVAYAVYEPVLAKIINAPGETFSETKLAVTKDLRPTTYFAPDVWFRVVVDAGKINGDLASIFDWKTGRPQEDSVQLAVMAGAIFAHMPAIQRVKAALVFLGHRQNVIEHYTREGMAEHWAGILPRVTALEQAHLTGTFPPKPSGLCRRYCPVKACVHHGG